MTTARVRVLRPRRQIAVARPGAAQSTIYLGNPVIARTDPDYLPLLVTNALLGGMSAAASPAISARRRATQTLLSTRTPRVSDIVLCARGGRDDRGHRPSLEEIFYEIDRLQATAPSTDELRAVQSHGRCRARDDLRLGRRPYAASFGHTERGASRAPREEAT